MAATPPMTPPIIEPAFLFRKLFAGVPSTVIVLLVTLREGPSQERKKNGRTACTNFRANGANTAPCAGLTNIMAISVESQMQFLNQLT